MVSVLYVCVSVCGASVLQGVVVAACKQACEADSGGQNYISQAHFWLYIVEREQCAGEGHRISRRRIPFCLCESADDEIESLSNKWPVDCCPSSSLWPGHSA